MMCALAVASGVSGARTWLRAHAPWLTPRRLKAVTIGLIVVGVVVTSIGLRGSSARPATAKRASGVPTSVTAGGPIGGLRPGGGQIESRHVRSLLHADQRGR
jgi:hypothetical protein